VSTPVRECCRTDEVVDHNSGLRLLENPWERRLRLPQGTEHVSEVLDDRIGFLGRAEMTAA
jgi:hypothetical protein